MATFSRSANFLTLALLTGCAAHSATLIPDSQPTGQPALPARGVNISAGWQFIRKDVADAQAINFDDRGWTAVNLPHTWNAADGSDGGNNYYRGAGWYRKHLTVTPDQIGKRLFLRFGAASLVADVFVNGQYVGQHRGGFAAFCFDVTDLLREGDNVVAVRVSNAKFPDIAPLSGDFTVFGGLYRDAELLALDPLHISPVDDASPGVYVTQTSVSADSATLDITTKLQNSGPVKEATVSVDVVDSDGKSVAYVATHGPVPAGNLSDSKCRLTIPHPHLWNGLQDPHLYTVLVSVNSGGRMTDSVAVPLGLRTVALDPTTGFLLNGKHYALHGVNLHQEAPGRGWAATRKDQDQAYALVHELGATVVRMAHYQHFDYEYELCDRLGIVVWAEVPLVNHISDDPMFATVTRQQLRELIKQQYNHPSIAFWSVFNEVSNKQSDPHWQLIHELNDQAHEMDATRLTSGAINLDARLPLTRWTDATAFNRYTGWYGGQASGWPKTVDEAFAGVNGPATQPTTEPAGDLTADQIAALSAADSATTQSSSSPATGPTTSPTTRPAPRPIAFSEYGAGGSVGQHELDPARARTGGNWHPEEYQALLHEQAYRAMTARPDVWGTFVWAMFDFSSDGRHEGDERGRNDKGLVGFDHQTKKDAFYFYKAQWSPEPFVHICDRRYQPHPAGPANIKVYSNYANVELIVNGRSLGVVQSDHGVFVWPAVPFSGKTLHVTARGVWGGLQKRSSTSPIDEMTWTIDPTATTHPAPATQPTTRRGK